MLVLDASVGYVASLADGGFRALTDDDLVAPALLWPETRAVLHAALWHGRLGRAGADAAHERLERAPVRRIDRAALGTTAWRIADDLGWARTYDAEYLALAQ